LVKASLLDSVAVGITQNNKWEYPEKYQYTGDFPFDFESVYTNDAPFLSA